MSVSFDPNNRKLPLEEDTSTKQSYTCSRVFRAVLPLLHLYQPVGAISECLYMATQLRTEGGRVVKKVAILAVSVVAYRTTATALHSLQAYKNIKESLHNSEQRGWLLFKAAHEVVYVASLWVYSPEIIAVSLIARVIIESSHAYENYRKEMYLEAVVDGILAAIRTRDTFKQIGRVRRNWFAKKPDQKVIDQILSGKKADKKRQRNSITVLIQTIEQMVQQIDFLGLFSTETSDIERELENRNYANIIENIDFSDRALWKAKISNLHFKNCHFRESYMENVVIEDSYFSNNDWSGARLNKVAVFGTGFKSDNFDRVHFGKVSFEGVKFIGCSFNSTQFSGDIFNQVDFIDSNLNMTNFYQAIVTNSALINCKRIDVISKADQFEYKNSPHIKNRPVVAIQSQGSWVEDLAEAYKVNGAVILGYQRYVQGIQTKAVKEKVKELITQKSWVEGHASGVSIPQRLLTMENQIPEIKAAQDFAKDLMDYGVDVLALPGGADVNPLYYGKENVGSPPYFWTYDDVARDLMGFAVTHEAFNRGVMIHGVCRGSQLLNVYFGGTLNNIEDWGWGGSAYMNVVAPVDTKEGDLIRQLAGGDKMYGYSAHHQYWDQLASPLTLLLKHNMIPKAFVHENGKVFGTQFHPEEYTTSHAERIAKENFQKLTTGKSKKENEEYFNFNEIWEEHQGGYDYDSDSSWSSDYSWSSFDSWSSSDDDYWYDSDDSIDVPDFEEDGPVVKVSKYESNTNIITHILKEAASQLK